MASIIKADEADDRDNPRAVILELADFAAEARTLVLEARKDAARIVAAARAETEDAQREAAQQGYAEGFDRGREEGLAQGRQAALAEAREKLTAESADLAEMARAAVEKLTGVRHELCDASARESIQLALRIAEKVVGQLADADIEVARANLAKALDMVGRNGPVTVMANPQQLDRLREYCPDLAKALRAPGQIEWVASKRISPGGVKVLTPRGEIDATIETQLSNIASALLGGAPPRRVDSPGGSGLYVGQEQEIGKA